MSQTYLQFSKKFLCSECNNPARERCHGIGEERALEKVWSDTKK
jgi:hypothetical protein